MRRNAGRIAVGCAIAVGIFWLIANLRHWQSTGVVDGLATLLPVPIAFVCGLQSSRYVGLAACAWIVGVGEVGAFNPFIVVIVFGPWLAGAVVRDRREVARRLEDVGRELEAESRLVEGEAVRLERARIARELHDIVAHCVSLIVVQAYAGERLVATDARRASEAFDHIADAADRARADIVRLVDLLDDDHTAPPIADLFVALRELAAGAAATGLDVSLRVTGRPDIVSSKSAAVAYRVVQEGVTNALKHAPGAPIVILVDCAADVTVDVLNALGQAAVAGLESTGGGHGLPGLRDRVAGLGGSFAAGPEPTEAWRVSVRVPSSVS